MTEDANYPATSNNGSGKRVTFSEATKADATVLRKAERAGFYYPMLALKQINSLNSGAAGKHNVFIPSMNTAQANSLQMFEMYMPGIKATIERRPNDRYIVTKLVISDEYKEIPRGGDKPGIYSVSKGDGGGQTVTYKGNNRITPQDGRVVVVCNTGYESPRDAAEDVQKRLKHTAGRIVSENGSFDIMYSPAGATLGKGFRKFNACSIDEANIFAGILSNAMHDAQKRVNINWISEYGGSAVFTQALDDLARQRVSFTEKKHTAYLYHPTTDPVEALELSQKVGLKIGDEFAKVKGVRAPLRMLGAKAKRARNPNDEYSWKDYSKDLSNGSMNGVALAGVGLFVAGLATSGPIVGGLAIAGTVTSGIGAAQLLWTKSKNLLSKPEK